jgi:hypothetical protein
MAAVGVDEVEREVPADEPHPFDIFQCFHQSSV